MAEAILNNSGLAGISSSDDATALRKYVVSTDKNGNAMTAVTHESGDEAIQGTLDRNRVLNDGIDEVGGLSKDLVRVSGGGNIQDIVLPESLATTADGTIVATFGKDTSDRYLILPPGFNPTKRYYKISKVQNGTAGTPTAAKGQVSGNKVTVTPSVTNSEGYISGGTKTGNGVEVKASELVSGNKVCSSGEATQLDIDVTNYATISIGGVGSTYVGSDVPKHSGGTYTPYSYERIVAYSGYYLNGNIKVAGDANLVAGNIKKGASIFGVSGSVHTYIEIGESGEYDPSNKANFKNSDGTTKNMHYCYLTPNLHTGLPSSMNDCKTFCEVYGGADSFVTVTGYGNDIDVYVYELTYSGWTRQVFYGSYNSNIKWTNIGQNSMRLMVPLPNSGFDGSVWLSTMNGVLLL